MLKKVKPETILIIVIIIILIALVIVSIVNNKQSTSQFKNKYSSLESFQVLAEAQRLADEKAAATSASGRCEPWCNTHKKDGKLTSWEKRCGWDTNQCSGCPECANFTTPASYGGVSIAMAAASGYDSSDGYPDGWTTKLEKEINLWIMYDRQAGGSVGDTLRSQNRQMKRRKQGSIGTAMWPSSFSALPTPRRCGVRARVQSRHQRATTVVYHTVLRSRRRGLLLPTGTLVMGIPMAGHTHLKKTGGCGGT